MATSRVHRPSGFTLLEAMLVVAILAVLATLAYAAYRSHVIRRELAQQLVDIDHIRSVLLVESRDDRRDLAADALPGAAPPRLAGLLVDREFTGKEGLRSQLVHAAAGTVPQQPLPAYGLVVEAPDDAGTLRLQLFYRELQNPDLPRMWLTAGSFLVLLAEAGVPGNAPVKPGPACPPAWTQVGDHDCKPPNGEPCPPPWVSIGPGDLCRVP